jgi:hypothetical protein
MNGNDASTESRIMHKAATITQGIFSFNICTENISKNADLMSDAQATFDRGKIKESY